MQQHLTECSAGQAHKATYTAQPVSTENEDHNTTRSGTAARTGSMRARTSPRYFCTNSLPTTRMKAAVVWCATAFASIVFPVPGGPHSSTPRGGSMPICGHSQHHVRVRVRVFACSNDMPDLRACTVKKGGRPKDLSPVLLLVTVTHAPPVNILRCMHGMHSLRMLLHSPPHKPHRCKHDLMTENSP